ncbi:MAG: T9SS type A sorting domain-containing protein [Candidatus Kapaibacteriales bacterium]
MNKALFIVAFFLFSFDLFAGYDLISDGNIDITSYPKLSLKIQLRKDSIPIKLISKQIYIIEDNNVTRVVDITPPDAFGFQIIKWYLSSINLSPPTIVILIDSNIVYKKFSVLPNLSNDELSTSFLKFVDNQRNLIKELKFGNVQIDKYTNKGGEIIVSKNRTNNGKPLPVRIDSVKTTNKDFKYLWLGSYINTNQPPVDIISPFPYSFEVIFSPTETKYYREYFTVYFDGGRQHSIALVGNSFPLYNRSQLQLISPNGLEILYPCQKYLIKWKGHNPTSPVFIEYTTNQGKIWNPVAQTTGESFLWTIPNIETDSLIIRIYQEYSPPAQRAFGIGNHIPIKVCFANDSSIIAIGTEDGFVEIYDVEENKLLWGIQFSQPDYPIYKTKISSLEFIENNNKILISYKFVDVFDQESNDTILILDLHNGGITKKIGFPQSDEKLRSIILDKNNQKFYLLPNLSNKLMEFDLINGNYVGEIKFDSPIINGIISRSGKYIVLATLDKEIYILNSKDFSFYSVIKCHSLPLISNLAISLDDRLIGFTTKPPSVDNEYANLSDAYVCDITSGQIIRSLYNNWGDAIGIEFSPTGNYLILAFENNPILIFWDIIKDVVSSSIFGAGYKISDFQLSPSSFIIATAEPSLKKVILRNFNYPEMDLSDGPSKIKQPKISTKNFQFPAQPIYFSKDFTATDNFCNIGEVPLIINNAYLLKGRNFHLMKSFSGDTLQPGECFAIEINFNPIDTGIITDTLIIESCGNYYFLPLIGKGINRNLQFLVEKIQFGSVCLNTPKEIELEIVINSDSLPFPIDSITTRNASIFQLVDGYQPQVLQSNQKLKVKLRFTPNKIGEITSFIDIAYLNQNQYVFSLPIEGIGIGTDLSLSTTDLRFLPEIPTRQIIITNTSGIDVQIDSITFSPPNIFRINTSLPFFIPSGSAKIIAIDHIGSEIFETRMEIFASPCAVTKSINLGPYVASSIVWADTIENEPKGTIAIPIYFQNTENAPYNGIREFEAKLNFNAGIFLPFDIYSDYGNSKISSYELFNGRRSVTFSVSGNFPAEGILATIKGYIGLAETDTANIEFSADSKFWGKSTTTISRPGLIKLISLCGNRRLLSDSSNIHIVSLSPNPIHGTLNLLYYISNMDEIYIKVFDVQGCLVVDAVVLPRYIGENSLIINVSNLSPGVYKLILKSSSHFDSINFVKIPE